MIFAPPEALATESEATIKALNPTTKVQDLTTPKGQRVWVVEHSHSKVISLVLMFRNAGAKSDPNNKEGRATVAAALFDEGAGDYTPQQLKRKFLENKIQWSVSCGEDVLEIFLRFPADNLEAVAQLLKLVLSKPRYQQDAMDRRRNEMLTEIPQSMQKESVVAQIARDELIYSPQHPYSRTPKQVLAALPGLTLDDVKTYRTECLSRDQLEAVAVGHLNAQAFLGILDDIIADLPDKATPLGVENAKLEHLGEEKIITMNIPQTFIYYIQPGLPYSDPDFIPATLMARILGGGAWLSRLWNEVREERGLAYHIDLDLVNYDHVHLLLGQAASKNETAKQVIDLIRAAWQKIYDQSVTQTELDLAKSYSLSAYVTRFDSTTAICKMLAYYQHIGLPPTYINERNALFAKVTLEDMNRVIKRVINPKELTFVVVGNSQHTIAAPQKDQTT